MSESEDMVHVEIDTNEWYPVFGFTQKDEASEYTVSVPASVVERWKRVNAEFDVCQEEMSKVRDGR